MASQKGQKAKGGKPIAGASALEAAVAQNAAGIVAFMADPRLFSVFTVTEDVGVPKKGETTDYVLKATAETGWQGTVLVPRWLLTKNGKLALRGMGVVGTKLACVQKRTAVERTRWEGHLSGGGCMTTGTVIETNFIVTAALE
jgi:hypothetical protein